MWITYSCNGGMDMTTQGVGGKPKPRPTPTPTPTTTSTCSTDQGEKIDKDIPLDKGWIHIRCQAMGAGGDRHRRKRQAMPMPCISIHKVMAGAPPRGSSIPGHVNMVS